MEAQLTDFFVPDTPPGDSVDLNLQSSYHIRVATSVNPNNHNQIVGLIFDNSLRVHDGFEIWELNNGSPVKKNLSYYKVKSPNGYTVYQFYDTVGVGQWSYQVYILSGGLSVGNVTSTPISILTGIPNTGFTAMAALVPGTKNVRVVIFNPPSNTHDYETWRVGTDSNGKFHSDKLAQGMDTSHGFTDQNVPDGEWQYTIYPTDSSGKQIAISSTDKIKVGAGIGNGITLSITSLDYIKPSSVKVVFTKQNGTTKYKIWRYDSKANLTGDALANSYIAVADIPSASQQSYTYTENNVPNGTWNYVIFAKGPNDPDDVNSTYQAAAFREIVVDQSAATATTSSSQTAPQAGLSHPTILKDANGNPVQSNNLSGWVNALYWWAVRIAAAIASLMILYAGQLYIASQGEEAGIKQAKEIIISTIAGFILLLILGTVMRLVVPTDNPTTYLNQLLPYL